MRRLRKPTPAVVVMSITTLLIAARLYNVGPIVSDTSSLQRRTVLVAVVIDGDTIETAAGERVRLLGIDAPEMGRADKPSEHYSQESTDWLRERILNTTVTLELGPEEQDRYGRTLAWIYTGDGVLVNQEAIATGNARLMDRFGLPLELENSLRQADAEARIQKRGLWRR